MSLITTNMFGEKCDKVKRSIDRIKAFAPTEGYFVGFSGGKDSVVVKALCDMAGVKYDAHYSVTTVDPPELVRFIKARHKDVSFDLPEMSMRQLIIKKQMPPTRIMRYCCEFLKETHGEGRVTMTGVRWAESRNRKNNQGLVTIMDGQNGDIERIADDEGAIFYKNRSGGVVLNLDNDAARRTVEICFRTRKTLVNPIVDWSDEDVWEFIRHYGISYCSLYDEGWKRLGCVGCPIGGCASQKREFERWPVYRKLYIRTFDDMLEARRKSGKPAPNGLWTDGEGVFRWWIGEGKNINPNQITIEDLLDERIIARR